MHCQIGGESCERQPQSLHLTSPMPNAVFGNWPSVMGMTLRLSYLVTGHRFLSMAESASKDWPASFSPAKSRQLIQEGPRAVPHLHILESDRGMWNREGHRINRVRLGRSASS